MLKEQQLFQLPDLNGKYHLKGEVNWNPNDPLTNEGKVVKFTLPDGKEVFVKREHLNQVLFAIGKPEDQQKMIPQSLESVHWRKTMLQVKATKDIRKGESVTFPIEISFPCTVVRKIIGKAAWETSVAKEQRKDKWASS